MSSTSRRDFFKSLIPEVNLSESRAIDTDGWVQMGKLSECSPGFTREKQVGVIKLTLRSSSEGVWVEKQGISKITTRAALRVEPLGSVLVSLSEEWPTGQGISHLTGAPISMDEET